MKKVALVLILLAAGLILYSQFSKPSSYTFNFQKVLLEGKNLMRSNLENEVEDILRNTQGRYGIYIKNLKTGEIYTTDEHEIFEPASLYKIWVMGAVFEKIKEGKLSEDDKLVADVVLLNKKYKLDGEEADLKDGVINFTVKSALEQMITISHNYAGLSLIDKVGSEGIKEFMRRYGLSDSSFDAPLKTTASDFGRFLERLYQGEVIDSEYSQRMIEVLSHQQKNDRLPKYLPEGTRVAHKTGELPNVRNDAGIVYCCKQELAHSSGGDFSAEGANPFIIVVLAETKNVVETSDKIARISEAAYNYFNSR